MVKFPYARSSLPLVPSSSCQGILTKVSRELKKMSDMKTGRAEETRASAFWPQGHFLTWKEWQEHWSKT